MIAVYTGTRNAGPESDCASEHFLQLRPQPRIVIVGDAPGVDRAIRRACKLRGIPFLVAPALWDARGRGAGPERNTFMLEVLIALGIAWDESTEVHAFPGPESRGTWNTVKTARALDLNVEVHEGGQSGTINFNESDLT